MLTMSTCQDNTLLAIDDMLLMYSGRDADFQVPGQLDGQPIHRIGMGACCAHETLKSVTLGSHITGIGNQAFASCKHLQQVQLTSNVNTVGDGAFLACPLLEEIRISSLPFSPADWTAYQSSCLAGPGGIPVSYLPPPHPLVQRVISSTGHMPASMLPPSLPLLFRESAHNSFRAEALLAVRQSMGFHAGGQQISEFQAAASLISSDVLPWKSSLAERENDRHLRREIPLEPETCLLFTAEPRSSTPGGIIADLHIWVGRFFWPSVTRVVWEQKTYHIYQRMYASSKPQLGYCRRDVAVIGDQGIIRNEAIARRIYAKYILPAIL